jgi:predicted Zn-dependent peptidase
VDRHAPELQTSGIEIFKRVKAAMSRMAYGNWLIMIRESLVRASVIRFLHAKFGEEAAEKGIQSENKRQFFWIGGLSNLLGDYDQTRTAYPTLDDFFPKIIEFFDTYADRIDQDVETMEKERQAVGRDASRQQFPGNGRKRLLRQNTQGVHYSG